MLPYLHILWEKQLLDISIYERVKWFLAIAKISSLMKEQVIRQRWGSCQSFPDVADAKNAATSRFCVEYFRVPFMLKFVRFANPLKV